MAQLSARSVNCLLLKRLKYCLKKSFLVRQLLLMPTLIARWRVVRLLQPWGVQALRPILLALELPATYCQILFILLA